MFIYVCKPAGTHIFQETYATNKNVYVMSKSMFYSKDSARIPFFFKVRNMQNSQKC